VLARSCQHPDRASRASAPPCPLLPAGGLANQNKRSALGPAHPWVANILSRRPHPAVSLAARHLPQRFYYPFLLGHLSVCIACFFVYPRQHSFLSGAPVSFSPFLNRAYSFQASLRYRQALPAVPRRNRYSTNCSSFLELEPRLALSLFISPTTGNVGISARGPFTASSAHKKWAFSASTARSRPPPQLSE
jgi:hypothetical protein